MSTFEDDDGDRCDDRREFEQEEFAAETEAEVARSRSQPYGGEYVQSLIAVQDAPVKEDSLDLLVPELSDRWPEPRLLWQRDVWFSRHRTRVPLHNLDADAARRLLATIEGMAERLHGAAARDESLTASSGLRRAMAHAGVPLIGDLEPSVWLESTLLVRSLRAVANSDGSGRATGPGPA